MPRNNGGSGLDPRLQIGAKQNMVDTANGTSAQGDPLVDLIKQKLAAQAAAQQGMVQPQGLDDAGRMRHQQALNMIPDTEADEESRRLREQAQRAALLQMSQRQGPRGL